MCENSNVSKIMMGELKSEDTSLVIRLTDPDERSSRGGAKSMVALGHGFDGFGP